MANSFSKQPTFLTARFLNDVNDAVLGGQILSVPSGITIGQGNQVIPGDRLILDDATALAMSDTAVGTLLGGVYMYVQTLSTATASPARGALCFFRAADIGSAANPYLFTSDAQPAVATPGYFQGIFLNAITKGNFGWIQIAGIANVLFDSAVTAASVAGTVSAKVSAAVASTADVGVALTTVTLAWVIGVAIGTPVISTVSQVILTKQIARW